MCLYRASCIYFLFQPTMPYICIYIYIYIYIYNFSVDKENQLDFTFVFFISLIIVAQHVSGNHVPIIRS